MTPDRVAIATDSLRRTYRDLDIRTNRLANALVELGVRKGDRVAYLGPNDPTYFDVLFGSAGAGAVMVPVNSRLAPAEVSHVLTDCGATVAFVAPSHRAVLDSADHSIPEDHIFGTDNDLEDLIRAAEETPIDVGVSLDDTAIVMYTSGTTGKPKGAMLTHGNLTWNVVNVLIDLDLRHDEKALVVAPLFHIAALAMLSLPVLVKGGTLWIEASFDPERTLDLIETERLTEVFGVPTMFNAIANTERWSSADLSSLRITMCGGAPVPRSTIDNYLDRGIVFLQGYGMTETAPGLLFLDGPSSTSKAGSAGVPSFFTDVRLVDDGMRDVAPGERGEILAAGPNVMAGYWRQPEATAASFAGSWFHTGDIAVADEDGYYTILDRVKDIIISGGENIYPAEVEDALQYHPAVVEAAVIGVPDDRWGEVGRAIVVLKPDADLDEEALFTYLRDRLAGYKIPKSMVFVDELPKSGAGKVLKPNLRTRFGA
jgi:fatty-acyl-CoA synthase